LFEREATYSEVTFSKQNCLYCGFVNKKCDPLIILV
jgi:hypothetical protein